MLSTSLHPKVSFAGDERIEGKGGQEKKSTARLTPRTVQASVPSNTFAIYGNGEDKELTELVPGILNQLGPDSLASLRKLAESYQSLQKKEGGADGKKDDDDDEDDIPELVEGENFESKVE
jgi:nascent polypeptide-associated complex subunit beta